jgi:hypothetical protein
VTRRRLLLSGGHGFIEIQITSKGAFAQGASIPADLLKTIGCHRFQALDKTRHAPHYQ